MKDIIRDSSVGQILNYLSNGRILPYADQRPDYVVPERYLLTPSRANSASAATLNGDATPAQAGRQLDLFPTTDTIVAPDAPSTDLEKGIDQEHPKKDLNPEPWEKATVPSAYLVTWDGDDDPDRPMFVSGSFIFLDFGR
jgi:DHA1 family multidrug resistance protein-like MFS transporter